MKDLLTCVDSVVLQWVCHWTGKRQSKGEKITLLPDVSTASCLGIISNVGPDLRRNWREGGER